MTESFSYKRDLPWHKRNKQRLIQLSFRFCHTCRDRDHLGSIMDRRIGLMEPMVVDLMMDTGRIGMIPSGMEDYWTHLIGEVVDMGITLVLIQTCIMVIIAIILIGGVTGDICRMS